MLTLVATSAFGLEAVVGRELEQLGYGDRKIEDGRVTFRADASAIARANLWLRSADRVLLQLGEFRCRDFDELYDQVSLLPWEAWVPADGATGVNVRSIRSTINSPRSAQGIVKKAIVDRLSVIYKVGRMPETGANFPVDVNIRNDRATVCIDTSGAGLHKRGYRQTTGPAPLKETLAAALVQLSFWKTSRPFADPFCGSGTVPIEAALMARNIAPGSSRTFLAESWPALASTLWTAARDEARQLAKPLEGETLLGFDIDERAIPVARRHAHAAGVHDDIHFHQRAFADFQSASPYGCLICNPPYGERLSDRDHAAQIYAAMQSVFERLPTWSFYVLTSHPEAKQLMGRSPDRTRKLYNGRLECAFYQYYGPRPPRADA